MDGQVAEEVVKVKDRYDRQFQSFTRSFYVMKSALRYFSVNQGLSFTSSKISDNFPVTTPVAGSALKIFDELGVVEPRSSSSSPDRYMPSDVNIERLMVIEKVLIDNYEIQEFCPDS